jgi:membrane protein DedA with SNARE-associated domain
VLDALVVWLSDLPPVALYTVIALLAAVENVFPPFPADTAIALGAFLSHRGVTNATTVYVVTLVANLAGAMGMYWFAARHSAALFRSKLAKNLLSEDGLTKVRREYQRFGLVGLFIGRLLPGFRAVVAPFAGLIHVGPWRAFVPMALASAIWYGAIVYGAAALGERWDEVVAMLGGVNRAAGVVAALLLIWLGVWGRKRWRRVKRYAAIRSERSAR